MAQVNNAPVSPLTALSRRWKLTTALVIVGIGAGIGVTYATPATYTGEARVAVGSQSLDARLVAGYTDASQQLASDVSRYVNDRQATADLSPVSATGRPTSRRSPPPRSRTPPSSRWR